MYASISSASNIDLLAFATFSGRLGTGIFEISDVIID